MSRAETRRRLRGGSALAIPAIAALPATLILTASPASAADPIVGSVGGYMYFGAGVTDANPAGDAEAVIIRDGEIEIDDEAAD